MATVATISVNFADYPNDFLTGTVSNKSVNPVTLAKYCFGSDYATGANATYTGGFLKRTGDTSTGSIFLPSTLASNLIPNYSVAVHKEYVDGRVQSLSSTVSDTTIGYVKISGSTMTGNLTLNTSNPTNSLYAASKGYVDSRIGSLSSSAKNELGSVYVEVDGGSVMTGSLKMGSPTVPSSKIVSLADPTDLYDATHKKYVDDAIAAASAGSVTKQYVDDGLNTKVNRSGDTMTGNLFINNANSLLGIQKTTSRTAFLSTGLNNFYVLRGAVNSQTYDTTNIPFSLKLDTGSASFSGSVIAPSFYKTEGGTPSEVATESFVNTGLGTKLNIGGGTMTGYLTLNGPPVNANHAATKDYVDDRTIQTGMVLFTAIDGDVSGFLLCGGQTFNQTSYPSLAAAIGYKYGISASMDVKVTPESKTSSSTANNGTIDVTFTQGPGAYKLYMSVVNNGAVIKESATLWKNGYSYEFKGLTSGNYRLTAWNMVPYWKEGKIERKIWTMTVPYGGVAGLSAIPSDWPNAYRTPFITGTGATGLNVIDPLRAIIKI